jgi:hypothetical protein
MLQTSLLVSLTPAATSLRHRISRAVAAFPDDWLSSLATYGVILPAIVLVGLFFHNLADITVLAAPVEHAPAKIDVTGRPWGEALTMSSAPAGGIQITAGEPAKIEASRSRVNPGFQLTNAKLEAISSRRSLSLASARGYSVDCGENCGVRLVSVELKDAPATQFVF